MIHQTRTTALSTGQEARLIVYSDPVTLKNTCVFQVLSFVEITPEANNVTKKIHGELFMKENFYLMVFGMLIDLWMSL